MTALNAYAGHLNASNEVLGWLGTTGQKALKKAVLTESEMEHVLDYLVSTAAPSRLQKMSIEDAKRKAREWSEANQKRGRDLLDGVDDTAPIHAFDDGTRIVELKTQNSLKREGFLMSHCVGGYSLTATCAIYSYRDADNMPHATFEVQRADNEIMQIKGKGNGPIHPKYIQPILTFLTVIGMEIRSSDMTNLGYYHIDKFHLEFLNRFPMAMKQVTEISGEIYAF